ALRRVEIVDIIMIDNSARQIHRDHILHTWSTLNPADPLLVKKAAGVEVFDEQDRSYLDFTSQLVYMNVGHNHPKMVSAIQEQVGNLAAIAPSHVTEIRGRAVAALLEIAPTGFERIFFT